MSEKQLQRPTLQNALAIRLRMIFSRAIRRTNESGSCLWCGAILRIKRGSADRRGSYGDNAFCGLRCGYFFGVCAAQSEFRLKPYEGDHV